jgi:hypothetical protein
LKDYAKLAISNKKAPTDLRLCAPHRMRQQSGTCWFNSILNIIILTEKINKNIYRYINELPINDKIIIKQLNSFDKLDLKYQKVGDKYTYPKYKLKHLISALFLLFNTLQKPNNNQEFITDMASHVKSIGKYGNNHNFEKEFDYIIKNPKKNPKYFGTAYDPYNAMVIMMQYFKLNRNNDVILIKGSIKDENKQLKLELSKHDIMSNHNSTYDKSKPLKEHYTLEAISYQKLLIFHASAGVKCKTDKSKYIIYDSNNIIKYEDWYKTQAEYVIFSIYC